MPTDSSSRLLAEARVRIDGIDDRIVDLLRERAEIVQRVSDAKRKAGEESRSAFRPEREARILRRLYRMASEGAGPDFEGLARIWREIMAAGLMQQAPISVGVPRLEGERDLEVRHLARQQFGAGCSISVYRAMGALYVAVRKDPNLIGIVPSLSDYLALASGQSDAPPIFASLPFWGEEAGGRAYAFGHVYPEPSGDDVTLISVSLLGGSGLRECSGILRETGISAENRVSSGTRAVLSLDGFWADEKNRKLLDRALGECCGDWSLLGVYARPLRVQDRSGGGT